jgi:hypothetical protein
MAATTSSSSTSETETATSATAEEESSSSKVEEVSENIPAPPPQPPTTTKPTTTLTDYVDMSKHLKNDPMTDLLTDTHITNFLAICADYFNGKDKIKKFQYVLPTFFESPYEIEDVTNFVTDFDENISILFIPVCYNTHWVLFVLRPKQWILDVYNSLENIVIPLVYRIKVKLVCEHLFKCKQNLLCKCYKLPKCLQQKDGINCGVFLCVYIEQIIRYGKVCDVINFNIEQERLRLDWIFFEVQNTLKKPMFWPPFSGQPILDRDYIGTSSNQKKGEDSNNEELETSEEDFEDDENVAPPQPNQWSIDMFE